LWGDWPPGAEYRVFLQPWQVGSFTWGAAAAGGRIKVEGLGASPEKAGNAWESLGDVAPAAGYFDAAAMRSTPMWAGPSLRRGW
jgi:hypothetical protein